MKAFIPLAVFSVLPMPDGRNDWFSTFTYTVPTNE